MGEVNKIFKIKEDKGFTNPSKQSSEAVEDYSIKKVVNTSEGTVEKVPVDDSDIVNKKYVDDNSATPAGTTGYVQFNDGGELGADVSLVWDDTNKRLGVGEATPLEPLHIVADASHNNIRLEENTGGENWSLGVDASGDLQIKDGGLSRITIKDNTGKTGFGMTNPLDPVSIKADSGHNNILMEEYEGGEQWQMGINAAGDLNFKDDGTTKVTFQDGGGVLITGDTEIVGYTSINRGAPRDDIGLYGISETSADQTQYGMHIVGRATGASATKNIYGLNSRAEYESATNNTAGVGGCGGRYNMFNIGSGLLTNAAAVRGVIRINGAGNITNAHIFHAETMQENSTGDFTNCINYYGEDQTKGVNNYQLYLLAGDNYIEGQIQHDGDFFFGANGAGLPYACVDGTDETVTCTTQNTWYQVTFDTAGVSNMTTISTANNDITILKTGDYKLGTTACIHTANAQDIEVMVKKEGGTVDLGIHLFQTTGVAAKVENMAGSCIVPISATDTLELWVRCTSAAAIDVIFDHVDLNCVQIGV